MTENNDCASRRHPLCRRMSINFVSLCCFQSTRVLYLRYFKKILLLNIFYNCIHVAEVVFHLHISEYIVKDWNWNITCIYALLKRVGSFLSRLLTFWKSEDTVSYFSVFFVVVFCIHYVYCLLQLQIRKHCKTKGCFFNKICLLNRLFLHSKWILHEKATALHKQTCLMDIS